MLTFLSCSNCNSHLALSLSSLIVLRRRYTCATTILVREVAPVGLLVLGLAPALRTPVCDGCGEWMEPV